MTMSVKDYDECGCLFCVEATAETRQARMATIRHRIARRVSADGVHITLWSTGHVLRPLGSHIPGWGTKRLTPAAAWLFMGMLDVYDVSELSGLADACRWCAKRDRSQKDVIARLNAPAKILFDWKQEHSDVRVSRLNRIQWPGIAVWNERGTYTVMKVRTAQNGDQTGTSVADFRTIKDLTAYLHSISIERSGR